MDKAPFIVKTEPIGKVKQRNVSQHCCQLCQLRTGEVPYGWGILASGMLDLERDNTQKFTTECARFSSCFYMIPFLIYQSAHFVEILIEGPFFFEMLSLDIWVIEQLSNNGSSKSDVLTPNLHSCVS